MLDKSLLLFLKPFKKLGYIHTSRFLKNHHFLIYYICSPKYKEHTDQLEQNHFFVDVIIAAREINTKKIVKFHSISVSMTLLQYIAVGDVLDGNGVPLDRSYRQDIFTIQRPMTAFEYVSIETDNMLASFFKNKEAARGLGLEKELFAKYDINGYSLYVPVVEIIRYFYLGMTALSKQLMSPGGIGSTYTDFSYNAMTNTYQLDIVKKIPANNRYSILYFAHNEEYGKAFNSVYLNWYNTGLLQAPIPFQPLLNDLINFKADYVEMLPARLVLKITSSDHFKRTLDGMNLSIYHPDQRQAGANTRGGHSAKYHRRIVRTNNEVDTDAKTDRSVNPEYFYDERLDIIDPWAFSINEDERLAPAQDISMQQVRHIDEESEIGLSTNPGLTSGGTAAPLEFDRESIELTDAPPMELDQLIAELRQRGLEVIETDGVFEDRVFENGTTEGRAQAYSDPNLTVRRRYKLLHVYDEEKSFYLLDTQEQEYDHYSGEIEAVRPGLLVFPDPGCEDFEHQFAKLLIANLVMNSGTWFTRKTRQDHISPIDAIYDYKDRTISLRHIENPVRFADSIMRAIYKLSEN